MSQFGFLTRDGKTRVLSRDCLDQLRNSLRGTLIVPTDSAYETSRKIWNGMIDKRPAAIVRCRGNSDVIATVNWARYHDLRVSIRSGGHNVSGASLVDGGVVIDLSAMRSVRVDARQQVARAEGGALLGDLDHETHPFGLAAPVGVVSATGLAGLTLHGGTGWLLRKHGLAIDNLQGVDIVTADGVLRHADAGEHEDLFWAIRGGGGNFGVVTGFELALHPVGEQVWMCMPIYPIEDAQRVLALFRDYMSDQAPEELMAIAVFWSAPDLPQVPEKHRGRPVVILLGCYSGPFESGEEVLAPLREIGTPLADLSSPMSWPQVQTAIDEDYPEGAYYYWKSLYLDRLDEEMIQAAINHTVARPSPLTSIDIWALGGAMQRVSPTATPFYKRDAPFLFNIEANWTEAEEAEANIAWARDVFEDMQRFSKGGTYLNFPGFLEQKEKLLHGAYGPNLERLKSIKAKYDPDNFFRGTLNISP